MRGLKSIGQIFLSGLKDREFRDLLFLSFLMLFGGALFYYFHEGWSYIDSLFFSVATLTTVGYGNLVPSTTLSKAFTIGFILVGIGLILALITRVAQFVEKSVK